MRDGAEDVVEDCFLLRGREFGLVRHVWDDDAPLGRRVVANWFWGMAGGASSEIQAPPLRVEVAGTGGRRAANRRATRPTAADDKSTRAMTTNARTLGWSLLTGTDFDARSRPRLEMEAEDRAQLEVRLAALTGDLPQTRKGQESFTHGNGGTRPYIENGWTCVGPIGKLHLMQRFEAGREPWIELVGDTKRLAELTLLLFQPSLLPFGFQDGIVDDRQLAEVFLQQELALQFEKLVPAFDLTVDRIYTVEAFQEYFAHLRAGGILSVSRLYDFVGPEVLRLTVLALAALREHGISNPRNHVFVVRGHELDGVMIGTVLVRLEPFDAKELHRLRFLAKMRRGRVVYAPDGAASGEWDELAKAADESQFCRGYALDVCPPTDDRPFFFNMARPLPEGRALVSFWGGVSPYSILMTTLAILIGLSAITFVVPLWLAPGPAPPVMLLGYFFSIGVGFILIEISLIQHFVLFLGFPTYALSVVLAGLLGFSGLGAVASGKLSTGRPLYLALAGVAALSGVGAVSLQPLLRAWIGYSLALRIALAVLLVAPIGTLLGMAMPLGLRRVEKVRAGSIPYAWGINGIASVLASVLGVTIAMRYGFETTGMVAASCYCAALLFAAASR